MNTTDIDPTAPPAQKQCTAHLFKPAPDGVFTSGSALQISDTHQSPPAILFDAVYAGAVLHHFGTQTLKEVITTIWEDTYSRVMTVVPADSKAITGEHDTAVEKTQIQAQEHRALDEAHGGPDIFDMLMILPYCMVPPDELQAAMREARERAEAAEQKRVQEKVEEWVSQVNAG